MVADLQPGPANSAPAALIPFNQAIYFSASGINSSGQFVGRELYRLDANGSVQLVADINPGSADSNPADFAFFDGKLVFAATGALGREIYQVDSSGTVSLVADVNPGIASSNPQLLTEFSDKLYFSAVGSAGREIYVLNRGGNTSLIADLNPGPADSNPAAFTRFGNNLYFTATGPNGRILYRESPSGTSDPFPIDLGPGVTDPQHFTEFNGRLYFSALSPTDGRELYALTITGNNRETVTKIANIDGTSSDSSPSEFHVFDNALYFAAQGQHGRELFRLEADGDLVELDLATGAASSSPSGFTEFNDRLYFAATVGGQRGLWQIDSAAAGLAALPVPLPPGVTLPANVAFYALSDQLFFAADGPNGRELYRLKASGLVEPAVDVNVGPASSDPSNVFAFAGQIYFVATDSRVGRELFVLRPDPSSIRVVGDRLVFTDEDGDRDNRVVVLSDGSNLIVRDENGHAISVVTPIAGTTGSGTNVVFLPFASIAGIDTLEIDTRGGNDSITFQLSSHADTILGQFSNSIIDGGPNSVDSIGDLLQFVGDSSTRSVFTPDASVTANGVVVVSGAFHNAIFAFANVEPLEFTGMAEATLVAPLAASGRDLFRISEGFSLLDGSVAALVVTGNVGAAPIESARFYGNTTVIVDTGNGVNGGDEISVIGAANAHLNTNLILKTDPSDQNPIVVLGAIGLAGNISVFAGLIDVRSSIEVGGAATLLSGDDVVFGSAGSLFAHGPFIALTADSDGVGGGGITMLDGSSISAGTGSITLLATGDITLGRLVTGNGTSSEVRVVTSAGSVRDGGDSGGADISAVAPGAVVTIQAAAGVGTASNALDLDVRHLVVITTNSDQFLAEKDALESLKLQAGIGSIHLVAAGSILDNDAELDVQASNLVLGALAVGSVISPLETQVTTLSAQLSGGGLELVEHDGLTVLLATALAPGSPIGMKSLSGDLQVVSLQASGLVTLETPGGAVLRSGGLPVTITAAQLEVAASGGVGTMLLPLRTATAALEADGGTGGVFIENVGDVVIGGIASSRLGLTGLAANGGHLIVSTQGSLTASESIHTSSGGTILLTASRDVLLGNLVATELGDISFAAARNLVATGSANIVTSSGAVRLLPDNDNAGGGTLQFAGIINAGSGAVIFRTTNAESLLAGGIQDAAAVIKLGPGSLIVGGTSVNSYHGVTEIREGTLQVDGIIGAISAAQTVTVFGGAALSGSGNVVAPVFSASTGSLIQSTGNLRLGDGSGEGFRFAGQLVIGTGHQVVLRDADLAELGLITRIASGGGLVAINGVEVGGGEKLLGSGAVAGNVVVLASGQVLPGASVGVLATNTGNLALLPGAQLLVDINGSQPGAQHDQIDVSGSVSLAGSVLLVSGGQFRPTRGTVLTLIVNDGTDPIVGRFVDSAGNTLNEGATFRFNGIDTTISYIGGPGANDVTLTVTDFQLVRTSSADTLLGASGVVPPPSQDLSADRGTGLPTTVNESTTRATVNQNADLRAQSLEVRAVERLRVFFRVVNDGTGEEEQAEYDLPPDVLGDLLHIFKRYRFQDGHYRIYLREPGKPERLILDVNVSEGRVVPANRQDQQIPDSQATPPALDVVPQHQQLDSQNPQSNKQPSVPIDGGDEARSSDEHPAPDGLEVSIEQAEVVQALPTGLYYEQPQSVETVTGHTGDEGDYFTTATIAAGIAVGTWTASPEWRDRIHGLLARGNFPMNNISRRVRLARSEIANRRPR